MSSTSAPASTRCALITGASSGIGKTFAERLAHDGWRVMAVARNQASLDAVLAPLPHGPHQALVADLSTPRGVATVEQALRDTPVDLLVNNAGAGINGPYAQLTWEQIQPIYQLNCTALAQLSHTYLRGARRGDALINVSSVLAFLPSPGAAMYAASKAFVTSLTEALWQENRARGVYVMALHPGITRTQFRQRSGGLNHYPATAQSPEQVVQIAMGALRKRRHPSVHCGPLNALLCNAPRLLSREMVVQALGLRKRREPAVAPQH